MGSTRKDRSKATLFPLVLPLPLHLTVLLPWPIKFLSIKKRMLNTNYLVILSSFIIMVVLITKSFEKYCIFLFCFPLSMLGEEGYLTTPKTPRNM